MPSSKSAAPANVAGVTITHPDRVVFQDSPITKRVLAEYYETVAEWMLPHVERRPLSIVRCPQGQGKPCFYQKHWANTMPKGLGGVEIEDDTPENDDAGPYVFVRDVRGVVALVQNGVLELHTWGARADKVDSPDRIVFDLDPAEDVAWKDITDAARSVRRVLDGCGLQSWLKTSGGKGLHIVVPIERRIAWDDANDFSRLVVARLMHEQPNRFVDVASKAARPGKIFIDYLRNARGATTVAAWSTRARIGAPVSVPITWDRLAKLTSGHDFDLAGAITYARSLDSDPWAEMLTSRQRVTSATMTKLIAG